MLCEGALEAISTSVWQPGVIPNCPALCPLYLGTLLRASYPACWLWVFPSLFHCCAWFFFLLHPGQPSHMDPALAYCSSTLWSLPCHVQAE